MKKIKKLNNKGETLIESVVSLLMLSILMIGAYKMITGSLNMIEIAYENDKAFRTNINEAIEEKEYTSNGNLRYNIDDIVSDSDNINQKYKMYNKDGIVAFIPE